MSTTPQDQVDICAALQQPLSLAFVLSLADTPVTGLVLPDGEVCRDGFGLMLVNQALLDRAHVLNQEPEAYLYLVDKQVEDCVTQSGVCLCVSIRRGEGSLQYIPLHSCRLLS